MGANIVAAFAQGPDEPYSTYPPEELAITAG